MFDAYDVHLQGNTKRLSMTANCRMYKCQKLNNDEPNCRKGYAFFHTNKTQIVIAIAGTMLIKERKLFSILLCRLRAEENYTGLQTLLQDPKTFCVIKLSLFLPIKVPRDLTISALSLFFECTESLLSMSRVQMTGFFRKF